MTNEDYLSVWLHFSEKVWIDKLQYFHEEIYFPDDGCHGDRKS